MTRKAKDTWMNPETSFHISSKRPDDGEVWIIQRQKRDLVFGPVSSITRWETWQEFRSKEERDKEMSRLRETTEWNLRGRRGYYLGGELRIHDPSEWADQ